MSTESDAVAALTTFLLEPEKYVTRATVSLSYPGTRDYLRRTTLDIQMPDPGALPDAGRGHGGQRLVAVPVGFAHRGQSLINFSLCDGSGAKLSLLTRSENEELTEAVLFQLLPSGLRTQAIDGCIRNLAHSDDGYGTLRPTLDAMFGLDKTLAAKTFSDGKGGLNRTAELFHRVSSCYLLFARVQDGGHRTIVTWKAQFTHDTPRGGPDGSSKYSPEKRRLDWWDRKKEALLLRWPRLEAEFPLVFAQSVHLEVELPDGVVPVESELDGPKLPPPTLRERPNVQRPTGDAEWDVSLGDVSGSRIHLASTSNRPRNFDGHPLMLIRPARWSWLLPTAVLTGITLAVATLTAWPDWQHVLDAGFTTPLEPDAGENGVAATGLIAAVVSLAIGIVNRRDEHELVNRVQGRHRAWMAAIAVLLLSSAIFATPAVPWMVTLTLWSLTAAASGSLFIVQFIGWWTRRLPPKPRQWRWLYLSAPSGVAAGTAVAQPDTSLVEAAIAAAVVAVAAELIARMAHFYVRFRTRHHVEATR